MIALAALRGVFIIAADPLLAVANNFDAIRVQACIDAYPDRPKDIHPGTNSPQAPFSRHRFVADIGAPCFLTSEVLFAAAAWPGMWLEQAVRGDQTFSFRWKGYFELLVWLALALWGTRRLIRAGRRDLAAGHAALGLIVIMDPGNTLYFNTFYSEASALLSLYALLLLLVWRVERRAIQRGLAVAVVLASLLLVASKFQHVLVPLLVWPGIVLASRTCKEYRRAATLAVLGGLVIGLSAQWHFRGTAISDSIRHANAIDTLFTALLPNASDPARLVDRLGLPRVCLEYSGSSWYSPGMSEGTLCPAAFAIGHADLLRESLRDPVMSIRALSGGVAQMTPWIPRYLGVVQGGDYSTLPDAIPSWSRLFDAMNASSLGACLIGLPVVALVLVARRRAEAQAPVNLVLLGTAILPFGVLSAAVFGDGYPDLARHSQLGFVALLAGVGIVGCLLVDAGLRRMAARH